MGTRAQASFRRVGPVWAAVFLVGTCGPEGPCTGVNPLYSPRFAQDAAADLPPPPDPDAAADADPGDAPAPAPDGSTPDAPDASDAPGVADALDALDTRPDAPDGSTPDGQAPDGAAGCGSARLDISAITRSDGVAVGPDGTLYFTSDDGTHAWVGRLPPAGPLDVEWLRIDNAPLVTGLAFDDARSRLYVASVSGAAIIRFDVGAGAPAGSVLIDEVEGLNDLALDADGNVYYSLQSDRHIHRVSPQGSATRVSTSPLGDSGAGQAPAALAFGPDGALFVGLKNGGGITRLVLAAGVEVSRTAFGSFDGWANGLAFDSLGRLYVGVYDEDTDTRLVRLDPDGANPSDVLTDGRYSGLVFGRGALDCRDLYAADPHGPLRRLATGTPGLRSP